MSLAACRKDGRAQVQTREERARYQSVSGSPAKTGRPEFVVEETGLEPATCWLQTNCSTC